MSMLKDRVIPEVEKREVREGREGKVSVQLCEGTHLPPPILQSELEAVFQRRVHEAVEKVRKQTSEEKQRILIDASKQLRDTVAQVRGEMEGRIAQAQTLAVREALKENNMQSNSKEVRTLPASRLVVGTSQPPSPHTPPLLLSSQNCWNCGRRATETCSGCNKARYCGTFCQHKDWGNHMHQCASGLQGTVLLC